MVVTSSDDFSARIWDANTGALSATLAGHRDKVNMSVFSPDGRTVLTVSEDRTAKLWDARTGQLLHTLVGHREGVLHASFSSDGKRVVTSSQDRTSRVWEVNNGKLLGTLRGHSDQVYYAEFSPDDHRILTTSKDGSSRLWDAEYFLRLTAFNGHPGYPYHSSFSPDGQRIVFAEGQHKVSTYKVLPRRQQLLDFISQNVNVSELTPLQREGFYMPQKVNAEQVLEEVKANTPTAPTGERKSDAKPGGQGAANPTPVEYRPIRGLDEKPAKPQINEAERRDSRTFESGETTPGRKFHIVGPSETLWNISKRYQISVEELQKLNNLKDNNIYTGQRLRVQ
jgi:LysM repeat protein